MKRLQIAQYIALGATAFSVIGFCLGGFAGVSYGMTIMYIGIAAGVVAYLFGGLLTALKMAWGIALWGWKIVRFPYDLIVFPVVFLFAIYALVFLPIIPIRKAYKNSGY